MTDAKQALREWVERAGKAYELQGVDSSRTAYGLALLDEFEASARASERAYIVRELDAKNDCGRDCGWNVSEFVWSLPQEHAGSEQVERETAEQQAEAKTARERIQAFKHRCTSFDHDDKCVDCGLHVPRL